ncbi:MAG: SLC13 family permease, partial [Planctomycetes bacterium]|nr:SLC13 family permease [Planctomycetota bacterium]
MEFSQYILLTIIALGGFLYVSQILAIETTSILIIACLALVPGLLESPDDVFSGFANEATLTIASMFVLSRALIRTGALEFLAIRMGRAAAGSLPRLLLLTALVVVPSSAFLNNTPIVIMMVPILLSLCRQFEIKPSKVLIPLSFFSILGGTCTLMGTSTNILVNSLYRKFSEKPPEFWKTEKAVTELQENGFSLFSFSQMGLIYLGIGVLFILFFARKLLPERASLSGMAHPERKAAFVTEVIVPQGSPLLEKTVGEVFSATDLTLLELVRGEEIILPGPAAELGLEEEDALIIEGRPQEIDSFLTKSQADLASVVEDDTRVPMKTIEMKLAEAVVLPDSPFEGRTVSGLRLNAHYGVKVMAVQRHGRQHLYHIRRMRVHAGDVLLIQADDAGLNELRESEAVLVVEEVDQTRVNKRKAPLVVLTLIGVVAAAAFTSGMAGAPSLAHLAIIGVALVLVTRCLRVDEALRSLDTTVLLLLAAAIPLAGAIQQTGLDEKAVSGILALVGGVDINPYVLLSAFYLLTSILTTFLSNSAV